MRLSSNVILKRAILRPALALTLGTLTFWVGLFHLVRISTRLTTRVFFGETPSHVVGTLEEERRAGRVSHSVRGPITSSGPESTRDVRPL